MTITSRNCGVIHRRRLRTFFSVLRPLPWSTQIGRGWPTEQDARIESVRPCLLNLGLRLESDPIRLAPSLGASRTWRTSALERVFDLLAGLLEVALGLVGLTLGLEVAVAAGLAHCLLGLAGQFLGLVL